MDDDSPFRLAVPLTAREQDILALLAEDLSDREIAARLFVAHSTVKWYNRQIFNKLGADNRQQAVERATALGLLGKSEAGRQRFHNLPVHVTPFIGRQRETGELVRLLQDDQQRLVTILAPGGMGKTRLAAELAYQLLPQYRDGVYFVQLTSVTTLEQIISTTAEALDYMFIPDHRLPKTQLLDFLADKQMLLILDNFEHLLDEAPFVNELLQASNQISVVVTSRERLHVQVETIFPLGGLDSAAGDEQQLTNVSDAVELFWQCAARAQPNFTANADASVVQICQFVEGMPLAIELAAAWVTALSPAEILTELRRNLDFLQSELRDVPARQRSIRAVFVTTWVRLGETEQQVFAKLSIFNGGFTREAAQAVTGAQLSDLSSLVNRALIVRDPHTNRFQIHELLRQYAFEVLQKSGLADTTTDAHCRYFAAFTDAWTRALKTPQQVNALYVLEADLENIRAAIEYAATHDRVDLLDHFSELWYFYEILGEYFEAETVFGSVLQRLEKTDGVTLGKFLAGQAHMLTRLGKREQARVYGQESLRLLRAKGALREAIFSLIVLSDYEVSAQDERRQHLDEGMRLAQTYQDEWAVLVLEFLYGYYGVYEQKDLKGARERFIHCLQMAEAQGNVWAMTFILRLLALVASLENQPDNARQLLENSLIQARKIRQRLQIVEALTGLAGLAVNERNFPLAQRLLEECLELERRTGRVQKVAILYALLGNVERRQARFASAQTYLTEALRLVAPTSDTVDKLEVLYYVAELLSDTDQKPQTVELLGFISERAKHSRLPLEAIEWFEPAVSQLREELSADVYEPAFERGRTLTFDAIAARFADQPMP